PSLDLLTSNEYASLGPEDKIFTLSIYRSKMARSARVTIAIGLLNIEHADEAAVNQNQAQVLPPMVQNQNQQQVNQTIQSLAEIGAELKELNIKTRDVHDRVEETSNGLAQQTTAIRDSFAAATQTMTNDMRAGFADITRAVNENFNE